MNFFTVLLTKNSLVTIFSCIQILIFSASTSGIAFANVDIDSIIRHTEERRSAIARMMEESTLFIYVPQRDSFSMGTGFVVADNYILTNAHVTDGNKRIYVAGKNLGLVRAKVIDEAYNNVDDFALLYISSTVKLPVLSFNLNLQRTDRVSAWGYPGLVTQYDKSIENLIEGMEFSDVPPVVYTEGTVSSFVSSNGQNSIIHTAAIAGGNSGGPLVNSRGEVVGINTWGATEEGEGAFVNAALHAQDAIKFLRSNGINPKISDGNFVATSYQGSENNAQNQQNPINFTEQPIEIVNNEQSTSGFGRISGITGSIDEFTDDEEIQYNGFENSTNSIAFLVEGISQGSRGFGVGQSTSFENLEDELDFALNSYLGDEGVPYDPDKGVRMLQNLANQGVIDAEVMLGTIYVSDIDYQNTQEGMNLLHKGAEEEPYYASILADFLFFGEAYGIEPDVNEALRQAERGSEIGDPDAQALLAVFYMYGLAGESRVEGAYKLAAEAAESGVSKGYSALSYLYANGIGVKKDAKQAFEYAKQAANEGDALAMGYLANYYLNGFGTEENFAKALEWAELGAIEGDGFSEYVLGYLYSNGLEVIQNLPLAWAYFEVSVKDLVTEAKDARDKVYAMMSKEERIEGETIVKNWRKEWGFVL